MASISPLPGPDAIQLRKDIESLTHRRYVSTVLLSNQDKYASFQSKLNIQLQTNPLDYIIPISFIERRIHLKHDLEGINKLVFDTLSKLNREDANETAAQVTHHLKEASDTTDVINIITYSVSSSLLLAGGISYYYRGFLKSLLSRRSRRIFARGFEYELVQQREEERLFEVKPVSELLERHRKKLAEQEWQMELRMAKREAGEVGGPFVAEESAGGGGALVKEGTTGKKALQSVQPLRKRGPAGVRGHHSKLKKSQGELGKSSFWRKDYTCKIYDDPEELKLAIRREARGIGKDPNALEYRDAVDILETLEWRMTGRTDHPKMVHEKMLAHWEELLIKEEEKYKKLPIFFNQHKKERINLMYWASNIGKLYGPKE